VNANVQMDLRRPASPIERSWASLRQSISRLLSTGSHLRHEVAEPVRYSFQGECACPDHCSLDHENE
jgi:hypothetical protein